MKKIQEYIKNIPITEKNHLINNSDLDILVLKNQNNLLKVNIYNSDESNKEKDI